MPNHTNWYQDQVIFLTGATGGLGGCLLYKLALRLPTKKIYVLCRSSMRESLAKWEDSMPEQIDDIFDTGKVCYIHGDMSLPGYGLQPDDLHRLQKEVTVVIHSAASVNFFQDLPACLRQNYDPVKELAGMMARFELLKLFVYISGASSCSFLPPGVVTEEMHTLEPGEETPDGQVASVLSDGQSPYEDRFPATYCQAKYLSEQMLMEEMTGYPVLIVRPSNIGPAIAEPYPFYGPQGSIPVQSVVEFLMGKKEYRDYNQFDKFPPDAVVDEIPVDLVANTCLLHMADGTSGIVHACAQLYVPFTLAERAERVVKYTPPDAIKQIWALNSKASESTAEQAYQKLKRIHGGWIFDCSRSEHLRNTEGAIGLSLAGHDAEQFLKTRIERSSRSIARKMAQRT